MMHLYGYKIHLGVIRLINCQYIFSGLIFRIRCEKKNNNITVCCLIFPNSDLCLGSASKTGALSGQCGSSMTHWIMIDGC